MSAYTNHMSGRRAGLIAALGAGLVLSGAAVAQQGAGGTGAGGRSGTTTSTTTHSDGGRTFTFIDQREGKNNVLIEMHNDRVVRAEFEGTAVPPERVVREGNTIILKNQDGEEIYRHEFDDHAGTPMPTPRVRAWTLQPEGVRMAPRPMVAGASTQKSMIGVRLGEVDQALRRHFKLKPGEATMVYSVSAGMPADAAGLEGYDIIIGIDGKSPANEEFVRATLREKDPGQQVTVTVIQRGQTKTLTITPEKYDREKLDKTKPKQVSVLGGGEGEGDGFGFGFGFGREPMAGLAVAEALEEAGALAPEARQDLLRQIEMYHMDEPGEDGDEEGAAWAAASADRWKALLERSMVGKVIGPNGKASAHLFVNGESSADYYRQMAEWEEQRANLVRELEEQQRDMAQRMRDLHQELNQLRQRVRTPTHPVTPAEPAAPVETPAPPTAPAPGAGAAKS